MTIYRYWTGGSNTAPYDTWAKAATTFEAVRAAATADGDQVRVHYTSREELAANTTYSFAAHVSVVSVDKDNSDAPTPMGTSGWIGSSSANRNVTLGGAKKIFLSGLTLRTVGGVLTVNNNDGGHFEAENFRMWNSSTSSSVDHAIGGTSNSYTKLTGFIFDCDRTSGNTDRIRYAGRVEINNSQWAISTSHVSSGIVLDPSADTHAQVDFVGCDFSGYPSGTTLVANMARAPSEYRFVQCKLPPNYVVLATQTTVPNKGSARAWVLDSAQGDTHGLIGYHDAFGSAVTSTAVYVTGGPSGQSWKITTTANCSFYTPFATPWIDAHNSSLSAATRRIEILSDGSATPYTDAEVWAEFSAKTTSGTTLASFYGDRKGVLASAADQAAGAGLSSWSGESGTAWSGKCDSGVAITATSVGGISGRICVGLPSVGGTLYVDPFIRSS